MKRIAIAAAWALVVAPALGAWAAFAKDGGPSPAAAEVRSADRHHGEPEPGDDHGHHGRHHRHGGDDGPGRH
jgi:hypothetical protein